MTITTERFELEQTIISSQGLAAKEAQRCLGCYDPPCVQACPAHIDIPRFIHRIATGDWRGSYETLVASNPLPAICGLICPVEDLCEGACVLRSLPGGSLRIGALQYYVASNFQQNEIPHWKSAKPYRVAVIGAGPAGLGCATALRRLGYAVDLYERQQVIGGAMSLAIPINRLPPEVLDRELVRLTAAGMRFNLGSEITPGEFGQLVDEYDAVFLGVGLSASKGVAIPRTDLHGVHWALDLLRRMRLSARGIEEPIELSGHVVVIGGGNVAMDAAYTAVTSGAERVTVLYRRSVREMSAWQREFEHASCLGVQFRWLAGVSAIEDRDGRVTGVRIHPMRLQEEDANGCRCVERALEEESFFSCDHVILAIGQALEEQWKRVPILETSPDGTLSVTNPNTLRTTHPKVFLGGDVVNGGKTVVEALAEGMRAGQGIDAALAGREAS